MWTAACIDDRHCKAAYGAGTISGLLAASVRLNAIDPGRKALRHRVHGTILRYELHPWVISHIVEPCKRNHRCVPLQGTLVGTTECDSVRAGVVVGDGWNIARVILQY